MEYILSKIKKYPEFSIALIICVGILGYFKETINLFLQKYVSNINTEALRLEPVFDTTTVDFKILLLPLHPDAKCIIQNSDYENKIIQHFEDLKKSDKLIHISCKFDKDEPCPQNDDEAIDIGKRNNADLIIWGAYDENIKRTRVRIRNNFISNSFNGYLPEYRKNYDSDYNTLLDLDLLRKGFLQENVDYIINFIHVATAFYFERSYEKVLKYSENYNIKDSLNYDINLLKASAFFHLGDTLKAIAITSALIEINPLDIRAYQNRATYYRDKGDFNKALIDINKVILFLPESYLPYSVRGSCYLMVGNYPAARNDYLKTLSLNGNNFYTHYNLAQAYWFLGNYDSCGFECLLALDFKPGMSYANALCAKAMAKTKKYYDANISFEFALENGYDNTDDGYFELAQIALGNKDSTEAMEFYQKSIYFKNLH